MPFVVKDLMISAVTRQGIGGLDPACAGSHCGSGCSVVTCLPSCSNNSCVTTLGGGFDMTPLINPADPWTLQQLKEQLSVALQHVEARQEATRTQMRPRTVEEVDALERQLTEALEELRTIRGEIQP